MSKKKTVYYDSFDEDVIESANQDYRLPADYQWVRKGIFSRVMSGVIYGLALAFSSVYCGMFLHLKIRGRKNLKGISGGYFIYANHTQPLGDVFTPALAVFPKRIYTVVSPANYGIPVLGRILPFLGALPIADNLKGMKEFTSAMEYRLNKKHPVVIYPEAHVWEYYTKIRPFGDTSFKFPVKFCRPAVVMTVTYKKSKIFKRPIMEAFLDGPFYGEGETQKERAKDLKTKVYDTMCHRSLNSDFEYIEYKKRLP